MVDEIDPIKGPSQSAEKLQMQAKEAQAAEKLVVKEQIQSEEALTTFAELGSEFNPLAMGKNFKEIDKRAAKGLQKEEAENQQHVPKEAKKVAENFAKRNPELNSRALLILKSLIKEKDSQESILNKVRSTYPDPTLADEALDFLIETSPAKSAMRSKLVATKDQFNEVYGREIRAGKNIQTEAQTFSKEGLGSPTALRDLYRDITGNPRTPNQLFDELGTKFTYPQMKKVIDFLLHSLGSDLKSKGPSISQPELQRLFSEARTLQAILGVYRFFQKRMPMIEGEFQREEMDLPNLLNFQLLAKLFMKMLQERYPSPERILNLARMMGLSEEVIAQIIIFSQYRDGIRNVSPKLFKSEKQRQDLLMCLIEALTDLEDELEEDDEEEEDDE